MRILIVTDTHLAASRPGAVANWNAVRAFAAAGGVDLTLHLGDITRDGWSAPEELPFAAALAADWPTPLRFVPGNHDVGDNPPGEDVPFKQPLSPALLADYRRLFGDDYWALDTGGGGASDWFLIGLNAQLMGSGTREELAQWDWLAGTLDDVAARPLAIFCHKPLYQDDIEAEPPHIRYIPTAQRRRLRTLLAGAAPRLFLSGHTHQHWDRMAAGIRHIWVPSLAYTFPELMQPVIGAKIVAAGLLSLMPFDVARFDLILPEGLRQIEFGPAMDEP